MNKNTALLIIDVQVEMFSDPDALVYKGDELLKNIKCLIEKARISNVPIIYIQHTESDEKPMGKGMQGWQIHPQIAPMGNDIMILKYTPDSFHKTSLHKELVTRNITKLVISGLQTECCVDTTCRRAFSLGYETMLVKDGNSTYDIKPLTAPQIIEHHHRIIGNWFAKIVTTDEVEFK